MNLDPTLAPIPFSQVPILLTFVMNCLQGATMVDLIKNILTGSRGKLVESFLRYDIGRIHTYTLVLILMRTEGI